MASRRHFLGCLGAAASLRAAEIAGNRSLAAMARDEDHWAEILRGFDVDRALINLNKGGVCPSPAVVMDSLIRDLKFSNAAPAHYMRDLPEPRAEGVRRELAREFGRDPEEMAIAQDTSQPKTDPILCMQNYQFKITDSSRPQSFTTISRASA